jgi:hypothetical protein
LAFLQDRKKQAGKNEHGKVRSFISAVGDGEVPDHKTLVFEFQKFDLLDFKRESKVKKFKDLQTAQPATYLHSYIPKHSKLTSNVVPSGREK